MPHPVMTGWWSNVVMVSYAVPVATARAYMPPGAGGIELEADTRTDVQINGQPAAVVSLIAHQCSRVRVFGVRWPLLNRFDAMYLRLAVKQSSARGSVYIREIAGSRLLAWGSRHAFNQPIVVAPRGGPRSEVKQQTLVIGAEYRVAWPRDGFGPGGRVAPGAPIEEHAVRVVGAKPPNRPGAKSLEGWLTDRPYVFGCAPPEKGGKGFVYEVIHPSWGVYPAAECRIELDFAKLFGPDWGFLSGVTPTHAMIAVGSEVAVFPKRQSVGVRWGVKRK